MTKKVLLVGSSFSAAPTFFVLKSMGFKVAVCGKHEHDPCHAYADESYYIDYSDQDALLSLVQENSFDFIVPTCNDFSYMSCVYVASRMSFPGLDTQETADILHTKAAFRKFTRQIGLPVPASVDVIDGKADVDGLKLPILVKPVDSFSGRGLTRLSSLDGLAEAIQRAEESSRSGEVVIEEFVEGSLHSHSAFFRNGKIVFDFFVDEYCNVYPYQVDCSNHPSDLNEDVRLKVRDAMELLASELEIVDGLLHTQFITDGAQVWVVECMRRCPGDLYNNLIQLSTDVKYLEQYVRPFVDHALDDIDMEPPRYVGRHTISRSETMPAYAFTHRIQAESVDIVPLKNSGEKLDPAPYDKLAILFAIFDSPESMHKQVPEFDSLVEVIGYPL